MHSQPEPPQVDDQRKTQSQAEVLSVLAQHAVEYSETQKDLENLKVEICIEGHSYETLVVSL